MFKKMKDKGVALFIVLATLLVVTLLAGVILNIVSSHSRLTHHQVSRIKAYYAARGIMNYVFEKMRTDPTNWAPNPAGGQNKYACHRSCIDSGITSYLSIPTDNDIPYLVQVTIYPQGTGVSGNGAKIEIKTRYSP